MPLKSLKKIKEEIICPPKVGEIIEGKIINRGRSSLFLDLGAKGIGVITGKELFNAKEELKNLGQGDALSCKVVSLETEDGYRQLSFSQANRELAWKKLIESKEKEEVFEVVIKAANKGGLICQVKGLQAFLPASQLLGEHYPKVEGGDPAKIAAELQKLIGKKIKVKIFDLDPKENKLILSEKAIEKEKMEEILKNYEAGDVVEGEISGITNFGIFLKFNHGLEGLIHASEIPEEKNKSGLKVGQKTKAKIIEIINSRIYLSLKSLS